MKDSVSAVVFANSSNDLDYLKSRLPKSFSVLFLPSLDKAISAINDRQPDYFITIARAELKQGFILDKVRELSPSTACIFFADDVNLKWIDVPEEYKNEENNKKNAESNYGGKSSGQNVGCSYRGKKADDADEKANAANKRINEAISKLFLSLGIPPHFKGYSYLRTGITLTIDQPSLISSVTTTLYPMIAERYGTTGAKVERSIRHALTVAWNKGRTKAFNKLIGVDTLTENDRPTSSEFIAVVTDRLLISEILHED